MPIPLAGPNFDLQILSRQSKELGFHGSTSFSAFCHVDNIAGHGYWDLLLWKASDEDSTVSILHLWGQKIFLWAFQLICLQFDPKFSKFSWNMRSKVWLFALEKVWIMGFCRVMGFLSIFSGNSVGGSKNVWGFTGYGLWPLWVMTVMTVIQNNRRVHEYSLDLFSLKSLLWTTSTTF